MARAIWRMQDGLVKPGRGQVAHPFRRSIAADFWSLPEAPGVYGFLFRSGRRLLRECGYADYSERAPYEIAGYPLLSIGSTVRQTLRVRIGHHLFGTARCSSLRRTVGTLLYEEAGLEPCGEPGHYNYDFGPGEAWLTDYLIDETLVVYYGSERPRADEWGLILRHEPPFNIKGLEHTAFAQYLLALRRGMADQACR